ncbi:MAG TPA: hypothetical protein VHE78_12320, partial [Gemmatimonadaceae bacterium]|nr:hypothetical protein [Gemmatimonadaceae bacterium]
MTIFELVARERARMARLVRVDTTLRALVVALAALTVGAVVLGGARWISLPRLVPFVVWAVAIALALLVARRGARRLQRITAVGAIADAVEGEQRMRRGAVRGVVELAGDTSIFVARAAQRLGA